MNSENKLHKIVHEGNEENQSFGSFDIVRMYSFAKEWFQDAVDQSRINNDHNARRREILFSVCFAESYIVEWVRDEALSRDITLFAQYFPQGIKRGVKEKWKDIPKELHKNNEISNKPNWGGTEWQEFRGLVDYRDGLIHASASRPETSSSVNNINPNPSKSELDNLTAGWAINIVVTLIEHLHSAVGTKPPEWLVRP